MLYDVAIIGGGIVGCAIARELSRYRIRTVVVEKECEVGFGTSKANSGIIHAGHHSSSATLKGRLVVEGNRAVEQQAAELKFGFKRVGEILVARNEAERRTVLEHYELGRSKGIPGLEVWDQRRLHMEEPNLAPHLVAGLHAPSAGVVNPYEWCYHLMESARKNGVELLVESPVTGIDRRDGFLSIRTPHRLLHTRYVVNAAGVWADRVAAMVGLRDFRILPRKGEEYMLDRRLCWVVRHVIFPCPTPRSKGILIIPTVDGTIMIGPTATDVPDCEDRTTTRDGAAEVFAAVTELVPAINARDTIAEFAGVRPVADTDDFIIGPTSVRGFVNVAGIQSPGLTAAPAIARYTREILAGEGLALVERPDFDPAFEPIVRFQALGSKERRRLIEKDPAYGRIVCRCEDVTEREVQQAIDQGARTLDGLKFRIRAGMGRCQGGFCTWRCMELLSERLGIPVTEVTKRGGGSWIVRERLPVDAGGAVEEGGT